MREEKGNLLEIIIEKLHEKCRSFVGSDSEGNTVIIDPVEHTVIGAHYAMSHIAAALIVWGQRNKVKEDLELGLSILSGMMNRWKDDSKLSDFHNDFNNFALCIVWKELLHGEEHKEICTKIQEIVLRTKDSAHYTINWLPMRIFVNDLRYVWTKDEKYLQVIKKCYQIIAGAVNADGFVEDLMPKGESFNLQYDAATVAGIEFVNNNCESEIKYKFNNEVKALVNACDPQGDINYLGRGCNQIFAWGLWLYLLKSQDLHENYMSSLKYLYDHIGEAIDNNNILLNGHSGAEKLFWWDYHYASVYLGHLYLWLVLTHFVQEGPGKHIDTKESYGSDSGVKIIRNNKYYFCMFEGRKRYFAEYGPVISNLFLKDKGYVVKGVHGPWMGSFGKKYANILCYFNHFGPLQIKGYGELHIHGISLQLRKYDHLRMRAAQTEITLNEEKDRLKIHFFTDKRKYSIMNIPVYSKELIPYIKVYADGQAVRSMQTGAIQNQYGEIFLLQTSPLKISQWSVEILL